MNSKDQIVENENRLLKAIQESDITVLDELLHDDLLFNIPNGMTITKNMDLDNYRSGSIIINSILPSDQIINVIDDTVIVAVTLVLNGKYDEQSLDGKYRYLRVWKLFDDSWKVIAGNCVLL
ncbi:nuclear transport factor 2 family protein [Flavobacterium aestivum]|uniref:nuclear transport factor 2 family protein n=1 Tax=Flavobacterium aestivum TaxID=3003257 RepID=UPI002285EEC4|nr:nuclear transport factor 2 family protein [Flavobacterium aestivum]